MNPESLFLLILIALAAYLFRQNMAELRTFFRAIFTFLSAVFWIFSDALREEQED